MDKVVNLQPKYESIEPPIVEGEETEGWAFGDLGGWAAVGLLGVAFLWWFNTETVVVERGVESREEESSGR